jgi:hypothetical protein
MLDPSVRAGARPSRAILDAPARRSRLSETGNVTANGSAASPGATIKYFGLIERPLNCRPARSQSCHIGANARPTPVRQAPIHRPPDPRRGLEEALRDAVATKSDMRRSTWRCSVSFGLAMESHSGPSLAVSTKPCSRSWRAISACSGYSRGSVIGFSLRTGGCADRCRGAGRRVEDREGDQSSMAASAAN